MNAARLHVLPSPETRAPIRPDVEQTDLVLSEFTCRLVSSRGEPGLSIATAAVSLDAQGRRLDQSWLLEVDDAVTLLAMMADTVERALDLQDRLAGVVEGDPRGN